MKKESAIFSFTETALHSESKKVVECTVLLHVYYKTNTFDVKPQNKYDFTFEGNSANSLVWLRVAELIKKAIDFGRIEVGQDHKVEKAKICEKCRETI